MSDFTREAVAHAIVDAIRSCADKGFGPYVDDSDLSAVDIDVRINMLAAADAFLAKIVADPPYESAAHAAQAFIAAQLRREAEASVALDHGEIQTVHFGSVRVGDAGNCGSCGATADHCDGRIKVAMVACCPDCEHSEAKGV